MPRLARALGQEVTDKRIDILRRIGEAGSISKAARAAGVSYKAAWQAVETLGNLAGTSLVEKAVGGPGGGGAMLTDSGRQVLRAAELLRQARAGVLSRLERRAASSNFRNVGALELRTSMRNQLPCVVRRITSQGSSVRVRLHFDDGAAPLVARITRPSAELLGLRAGLPVLALCKATAVNVARAIDPRAGANLLQGEVSRLPSSSRGGEVSLLLPGGLQLVGFVASGHGLKIAARAVGEVDESAIVIAIA